MRCAPHSGDALVQKLKPRVGQAPSDRERLAASLAVLAAHGRDAILEAVAMSAKELLRSSDLHQTLPKVIERIGQATGVDRTHIFEIDTASHGGAFLWHCLWSAPGISTPPIFRDPKVSMADVGLASWIPKLLRGETIAGHVRNLHGTARELFELGGVKSVLCVPVFVDGHWWGMIGFDDCRSEREWSAAEIDTIKTLAELVGAAIARTRRQQNLADANRIIENSPTILFRLGGEEPFPVTFVSQNIRRYGYEAEELLAPGRWPQLIASEDLPTLMANIKSMVDGKADYVRMDFRFKKPDGSHVWFEGEANALRDESGHLTAIEGILTDITERKAAAETIATLARTDSLTGLPNRAAFLERLQLEFARAKRGGSSFAILYLDLDHFKDVNDTLGHPVGDALLQAVADRLKSCTRETDMVARFGGDEFAVLQDHLTDIGSVESIGNQDRQGHCRSFLDRRQSGAHHGQHRDRALPRGRRGTRVDDHEGRPRPLPREGRRTQSVPLSCGRARPSRCANG